MTRDEFYAEVGRRLAALPDGGLHEDADIAAIAADLYARIRGSLQETLVAVAFERDGLQTAVDRAALVEAKLREAVARLDWYVLGCVCPGELCISACKECNKTQRIVNGANDLLRG